MIASPDWYKSFFNGLAVEFWKTAIPPEATRADAQFFAGALALSPGSSVLDVPCGHGRFSLELARRGCRVTGVDISPEFLEAGRAAARAEGLSIDWRQSDMRELPWQRTFDAVLCAGNSFGYFDDAGHAAFLCAAAKVLVPGGRLLLDSGWIAESQFPSFRSEWEMESGSLRFTGSNAYDPVSGRVENRYVATRGDRVEEREASHRVYTVSQVLAMLRLAGFAEFECYGGVDGGAYRLGSPRLLLVARRAL